MRERTSMSLRTLLVIPAILAVSPIFAAEAGESKEALALKNRSTAPPDSAINGSVTVDALLSNGAQTAWSEKQGARLDGYVTQVERDEDGDVHVVLAAKPKESDTTKWVIVEVTPAWQKKSAALSYNALRRLYGKHVRVTGWLYYEPEADQPDPRGTRWELHPATAVEPIAHN